MSVLFNINLKDSDKTVEEDSPVIFGCNQLFVCVSFAPEIGRSQESLDFLKKNINIPASQLPDVFH